MLKRPSSTFIAITGLVLLCLLFFGQLLFSGEIINATDILTQQYFWNIFIQENLFEDPCFQTWLPYINAGTPFSGGLNLIFRPVAFLTLLIFPAHTAISYEVVMYLLLMGLGMYLYMRELRLSAISAFLAGLFLMLNGEIVSLINAGHINKIGAIFPTPFVFWALERALRRKTPAAFLLTGAALGFQFWQGHIQISYYLCIAVAIYFIARVGLIYRQQRNVRQVSSFIALGVMMVIVFLLLSAVEFLPLLSFAQVSERAEGVSYEFATSWSMPPEELATYLIPDFFGFRRANHYEDEQDVLDVPYWGRMPFTQTGRYFGLLPLLLMGIALCFVRKKHVAALAAIALIVLLLGMGRYIPTYKLLYQYVPGFNMFRVPQMILFLLAFASSALAGCGAEWLLTDWSAAKARRLRLFVLAGIGVFLLAWLLTLALPHVQESLLFNFKEALLRKGATEEIATARLHNILRGFVRFTVMFGIALFVLGLRLTPKLRKEWILAALVGVYLVDIARFNDKYLDTIPLQNSFYVDENDAIRYLKNDPGLYRVLSATNKPESYAVTNKYVRHHLFSVSGYEAVGVQYYNEFMQQMQFGTALPDLLNIKYIILPKDVQLNDEEIEVGKTVGPYKIVMDSEVVLLENLRYLPRAFAVHQAQVAEQPEQILPALQHPSFNPRETVILEEYPQVAPPEHITPSSQSTVEIASYRNRTIQISASMAQDGFLVLSEKYYPGWKAYVDGQPTHIYKADYTLQAIFLPQGEHEVTFAYQPRQFMLGLLITTVTIIGLLLFVMRNRFRPRPVFMSIHKRCHHALHQAAARQRIRNIMWGLIAFGIILNVFNYTQDRSFTVDEVGTVLSMSKQPLSELLRPLSYNASAPVGFVAIQKAMVALFGDVDYVWRLFPFLSRLMSIGLFYYVASSILQASAAPFALLFFIFSDRLLSFSTVAYQYSSDVFFALLIYAIALFVKSRGVTRSGAILLAISGALIVWCSFPAVFVMAGVGIGMFASYSRHKNRATMLRLLLTYVCWIGSFLLMYALFLRALNNEAYLLELSKRHFAPFPPRSLADVVLILQALIDYMGYAVGWSAEVFRMFYTRSLFAPLPRMLDFVLSSEQHVFASVAYLGRLALLLLMYLAAFVMLLLGALSLYRRKREAFFAFCLPACFLFVGSGLFKLPLRHRLALFLFPAILIGIVEGITQIRLRLEKTSRLAALIFVVIFLIYPVGIVSYQALNPGKAQHVKPMIRYLQEHKQTGDVIYVYYGANQLFEYYTRQFGGFEGEKVIYGIRSREDWNKYIQDLTQLRGQPRAWILFSHIVGDEEKVFLSYLNYLGKPLDMFHGINTGVYLYDLRQN